MQRRSTLRWMTTGMLLGLGLGLGTAAMADKPYPSQPIKIVLPYGPGASTDMTARLVGQKLSVELKQPVIVDNRAGASGMIGSDFVAKSAPDGYTILLGTDGTHAGNPHLIKNHPFNPVTDVTPLTLATRAIMVLVAHPSVPANNFKEFIAYVKANPGKVNYASSGNGSPHHLGGALLNQMAGIEMTHVAYKGGGQALTDVVGGQVQVAITSLVTAAPHIKAGKLKVYAVTEKDRYKGMPDLPTIGEFYPGYEMSSWLGFMGPAKMPAPIAKTVSTALIKVLHLPDVVAKLEESGLVVVASTPEEFAAQLKADYEFRGKFIKQHNIGLE